MSRYLYYNNKYYKKKIVIFFRQNINIDFKLCTKTSKSKGFSKASLSWKGKAFHASILNSIL